MRRLISKVSGHNFKGGTFKHELAPVTWFSGRNFVGKSSRVQCALLAYAGWLPGVGSTGPDLFERLSSGPSFSAHADYSDGTFVDRVWTQRNGSVKCAATGDKTEVPDECVDATEFLLLSDTERTRYLFRRGTLPEDYTVAKLANTIIANVKNIKGDPHTEAHEAAIQAACERVQPTSASPQDWLSGLVDASAQTKKDAMANVQRLEKTLQGLAQVSQDEASPPQDAEQRLHKARTALEEALKDLARVEEAGRTSAKALKDAEALASTAVDTEAAAKEAERLEMEAKEGPLTKVPAAGPEPVLRLDEVCRPDDTQARRALDAAVGKANELLTEGQLRAADVARIKKQVEEAEHAKVCPTCKQSIEHLQKEVVKGYKADLKKAQAALNRAENDNAAFTTAPFVEAFQKVQAAQKEHDAAVAAANKDYQSAVVVWQGRNRAYENAQRELRAMENEARTLRAKVAANAQAAEAAGKMPTLKAALEQARADYTAAKGYAENTRTEVSAVDMLYKRLLAVRAEESARARAKQELDKGRVEAEVAKQVAAMLTELQAKLVEVAVGPFLARCNALCSPILKAPLAFKDGELGMLEPSGFHSWKTLSGTETTMAYAAVSVACAQGSDFKLCVFDEFDIDDERLPKLCQLMCDLQNQGVVDQVLIAHTVAPQCDQDNFLNIKLGID